MQNQESIFDTNKTINTNKIAVNIQTEHKIIFCAGNFYLYENGYYRLLGTVEIEKWIKGILKDNFSAAKANEVIRALKADCHIQDSELNNTNLLNLRNGLLNVDTLVLQPHTPDVYSTVQLDVNYNVSAVCPLWVKTVTEIFRGDQAKHDLLQEFFGLCLTKEQKHRKALFCIGEGKNGKSTVLEVLEGLVGSKNRSAIPIEMFSNRHYLANLHGRLLNVSNETNAKADINDSNFKAVVSGDSIEADRKFGQPFTFQPFCKIAIATNNLPRVDDKTDAFFDRLLILPFTRVFEEHEQDKALKYKLQNELDGILLWAIEGLKRLRQRGHFQETTEMQAEKAEYRKENNNVLVFIDEACQVNPNNNCTKDELYKAYQLWCTDNGNRALSKIKFGKELRKRCDYIDEYKVDGKHCWVGVSLATNPMQQPAI